MSKPTPVDAVHKLLAKVESGYHDNNGTFDKIRTFTFEGESSLFEFNSGKFVYLHQGRSEDIDGVHGGLYSVGAMFVVEALLKLHRITQIEHDAFFVWWLEEEEKETRKWKLDKLKREAEELGFQLVKTGD